MPALERWGARLHVRCRVSPWASSSPCWGVTPEQPGLLELSLAGPVQFAVHRGQGGAAAGLPGQPVRRGVEISLGLGPRPVKERAKACLSRLWLPARGLGSLSLSSGQANSCTCPGPRAWEGWLLLLLRDSPDGAALRGRFLGLKGVRVISGGPSGSRGAGLRRCWLQSSEVPLLGLPSALSLGKRACGLLLPRRQALTSALSQAFSRRGRAGRVSAVTYHIRTLLSATRLCRMPGRAASDPAWRLPRALKESPWCAAHSVRVITLGWKTVEQPWLLALGVVAH